MNPNSYITSYTFIKFLVSNHKKIITNIMKRKKKLSDSLLKENAEFRIGIFIEKDFGY